MKPATIKALQELCDALMDHVPYPGADSELKTAQAADRLKRVLDEEPKEKEHNVTED